MWNKFITFLFRMLRDERGEVGDNDPDDDSKDKDDPGSDDDLEDNDDLENEPDPNSFLVDDLEDNDDLEDDDKDKKKTPAGEDEDDAELNKRVADLESKLKDTDSRLQERENHIKNLNKALHDRRLERKAKDSDEGLAFTDAQIVAMLEEHKDDPAVQLQIMKHVSAEAAKGAKADAISETELSQNKKALDGLLEKTYPALKEEGSDIRLGVDSVKAKLGLSDHPLGDAFATGVLVLENLEAIRNTFREQGKQEALKEKAEDNRKKKIKESGPDLYKNRKTPSNLIPSKIQKVAREIELNPKQAAIYAKLLKNANMSAEV